MSSPAMQRTVRLGDALVQARLITQDQLRRALEQQKLSGDRLGTVLMRLGFVSEYDIYTTLASQMGYRFAADPADEYDPGVRVLVTEELVKHHRVVPLRLEGNDLVVATADPTNFVALDDISLQSGRRVIPVVASERAIQTAILKAYGMGREAAQESSELSQAFDLEGEAGDSATIKLVNKILIEALNQRATDIHIDPTEKQIRVRFRIDGIMQDVTPLSRQVLAAILSRIKVMARLDIAERRLPQDGRIDVELQGRRLDLRVATIPTVHGEKVAIRILDRGAALVGLGELGMEPAVLSELRRLIRTPNGMFLVTGPTGSGKTTTLMGALLEINNASLHILTIEDPVEYHIHGVNQVQVNTKAGLTFAEGIRSFLRQDPDVLMVGEVRDRETADIAVRAALTGHLVLSTLHTNQAAGAPGRLIDMGVEPFLIASSLMGVFSQRLVRSLCSHCRQSVPESEDPQGYQLLRAAGIQGGMLHRSAGCGRCHNRGFAGRMLLVELLVVTDALREIITRRGSSAELAKAAREAGMVPLWQDGLNKAARGLTTLDEVRRVAYTED